MPNIKVVDMTGKEVGEMTLSDADSMLFSVLICSLLRMMLSFTSLSVGNLLMFVWIQWMYLPVCMCGLAGMVKATMTPAMVA
jgi:hypothetical protein